MPDLNDLVAMYVNGLMNNVITDMTDYPNITIMFVGFNYKKTP